jgi:hypothetical protein
MAAVQPEPWLRALITNNNNINEELFFSCFLPRQNIFSFVTKVPKEHYSSILSLLGLLEANVKCALDNVTTF